MFNILCGKSTDINRIIPFNYASLVENKNAEQKTIFEMLIEAFLKYSCFSIVGCCEKRSTRVY